MTNPGFSICSIEPAGYRFAHFLYDACKYLCFGIESAGYDCCLVRNRFYSDRINILVGSHNLTNPEEVARIAGSGRYVLFQTEVITGNTINNWAMQKTFAEVYLPLMRQAAAVWTGGFNIEPLKQFGIEAEVITFGYHPSMEEVVHKKNKDIDFLYFGSLTDHRKKMVDKVIAHGGKVVTMFDDAALFRNDLIARTKVNLAPHQGPGRNHMTGKILHLVNNRAFVVVEKCSDQRLYEECFIHAETDLWADLCLEMVSRPDLDRLAEEYHERFSKIRMEDFLRPLIEKLVLSLSSPPPDRSVAGPDILKGRDPIESAGKGASAIEESPVKGKTSIIIATDNKPENIKKCLKSVMKHTAEPYEIIFIDDGSSGSTLKWLQKKAHENRGYTVIEDIGNTGIARAYNQGIEASKGEYIVLLSNDVIVTKEWLSGMYECLNSSSDIGIVGPMMNNISGPQNVVSEELRSLDYLDQFAEQFKTKNRYRRIPVRTIAGHCMLFRRSLTEKIGLFDEDLGTGNFIYDDYCLRSVLEGYRVLIAGDVFVHQSGSAGSGKDSKYSAPVAGKKLFENKWRNIPVQDDLGKRLAVLNAIERGDECYRKQLVDQAISALIEGVTYYPDAKRLYYRLAEILLDAKLYKDALEALDAIAENGPEKLALAGYCLEGLGQLEEACRYADNALNCNEKFAFALNLKGIVEYKRGGRDVAEAFFLRAIDSDPGYGEPYSNLGVMKWTEDDRITSLDLLVKGFLLSPLISDVSSLYHSAVVSSGELVRGEKSVRSVLSCYPDHKIITLMLVDILLRQGKKGPALNELQKALIIFGIDDQLLADALAISRETGPGEIDPSSKNGTMSVCLIVKNEETYLSRCLMSILPVADEIIVVDTGSSDRTRDIATAFGAKVFDFPWTGDFSEARNFSLSHAHGDWILVLDGDEVISEYDYANLRRITDNKPLKPAAYNIVTRNYVRSFGLMGWNSNTGQYPGEETGTGWIPSDKVRFFPNSPAIRFKGHVHELVENSLKDAGIPVKISSIVVHHYGKLDAGVARSKGAGYYQLGMRKLEQNPDDVKAIFELANQAQELERYEEAIDLWLRAINLTKEKPVAAFFYNISSCYLRSEQYEACLSASKKAMELDPQLKEASLNHSYSEILTGDCNAAVSELENLLVRIPDYPPAMVLLASAYIFSERNKEATDILRSLSQKNLEFSHYQHVLSRQLIKKGMVSQARLILENLISIGKGNNETQSLLNQC